MWGRIGVSSWYRVTAAHAFKVIAEGVALLAYLLGVPVAICLVPPIAVALVGTSRIRSALCWAALFLGLLILDIALVYLPLQSGVYETLHLQFNWFGKCLAVVWAVLFLAFGPLSFQDAGVRKPRPSSSKSAAIVVAVLAAVAFIAHWFLSSGTPRSAEMLLYQLTMPAIAEELVFRGLLFAILERAFREATQATRWWQSRSVWVTALAFALFHGWSVSHGSFQFNAAAFALPFVFGVIAGALRKRTGSLLFPVVLHSVVNFAAAVFP